MSDGPSRTLPDRGTWPKNPSGTIDWEVVFEQPETGLLAHIARTESAAELRAATQAVIAQLFPRKDDEDGTARLAAELVELLPEDTGPATLKPVAEAVQQTLRGIKHFRQKKAGEYEREQASKPPQEKSAEKPLERRKPGKKPPSLKKTLARKRKLRLIAAVAVLALIGGGIGAYQLLDLSPSPAVEKPKKLAYCDLPKVTVVLKNEANRTVHSAVIAVSAEFNDPHALAVCKAAQPRILDALQVFLRNTTYEELQGTGGSELLRAETTNIVNREVGPFRANTILFKQILIQ
jgi:flagellar FliL protein